MSVDEINYFIVILIYGSLIMLSFLLITNPLKVNKKANLLFGFFLFLWSTFWIKEIFTISNINYFNEISVGVRFFQFLTPIIFYFSVNYYTNPDSKFKIADSIYLILPVIFFVGLTLQKSSVNKVLLSNLLNALVFIQAFYFIVFSYVKIIQHKKKIKLFSSNIDEIDLKWIVKIIIALFILSIFIGLYNVISSARNLNLFANIVSIIIIFFVGYNAIKQKEIFLLNENQRNLVIKTNEDVKIAKRKVISDNELNILKSTILVVMDQEKPFLNPELSLSRLAELLKITPHQLSYAINAGFGENFFMFINRYRVEKAKELLLNEDKSYLSIIGIAFESGFNSKTSFNITFKKISLQTPSEFKKRGSSL